MIVVVTATIGGAGLSLVTLATFGAPLVLGAVWYMTEPDGLKMLQDPNDRAIKTVDEGLERMYNQSVCVQDALRKMVKTMTELKTQTGVSNKGELTTELDEAVDNYDEARLRGLAADVKELDELWTAVNKCKKNLDILVADIDDTEKFVDAELKNYETNIHGKLLNMVLQ